MKNNFLLSIGQKSLSCLQSRGRRIIALSIMTVLLTGIIALASIPGADGVIHGCYNKNGDSSLRVIDSNEQCKSNETALNFNQSGPRGLQGLQGQPGQPGANGISEAYAARQVFGTVEEIALPTVLLSKNVPAGSYVINAKTQVRNFSISDRIATCNLSSGDISSIKIEDSSGSNRQILTLQDTVTFDAPVTITLTCVSNFPGTFVENSALTAVKVDAIY